MCFLTDKDLANYFWVNNRLETLAPPSAFETIIHHAVPGQHAGLNMAKCLTGDADSSACVLPATGKKTDKDLGELTLGEQQIKDPSPPSVLKREFIMRFPGNMRS